MMTYCARIVAIGLFVADGLADRTLITFDSNGPKDCLDYSLSLEPSFREVNLLILPGDRLLLASHDYLVTAVGKEAQQSLFELGHQPFLTAQLPAEAENDATVNSRGKRALVFMTDL